MTIEKKIKYKIIAAWVLFGCIIGLSLFAFTPRTLEVIAVNSKNKETQETTEVSFMMWQNPDAKARELPNFTTGDIYWDRELSKEYDGDYTVCLFKQCQLFASVTPNEYPLIFFDGSNKLTNLKDSYFYGQELDLSEITPTKWHYTFSRWRDRAGNTIETIPAGTTGQVELYADFTPNDYTISYELNGGVVADKVERYSYNTDDIILPIPKNIGYIFNGWYTEPSMVNRITKIDSETNGDLTLYAKWISSPWANLPMTDNTDDRELLTIGNEALELVYSNDQEVVDSQDTAAYFYMDEKTVIADHAYQGFDIIRNVSLATWRHNGQDIGLSKTSQYTGQNTGEELILDDGRTIGEVNDGWLVMYTCLTEDGRNVIITFWN